MPRSFESFSLKAFLVFISAKAKGALLQNTMTAQERAVSMACWHWQHRCRRENGFVKSNLIWKKSWFKWKFFLKGFEIYRFGDEEDKTYSSADLPRTCMWGPRYERCIELCFSLWDWKCLIFMCVYFNYLSTFHIFCVPFSKVIIFSFSAMYKNKIINVLY